MAEILAIFRIMPEEAGKENSIVEALNKLEKGSLKDVKTEPFAFGLNAVIAAILIEEKEGSMDAIEEEIKAIEGVSDARLENAGRL